MKASFPLLRGEERTLRIPDPLSLHLKKIKFLKSCYSLTSHFIEAVAQRGEGFTQSHTASKPVQC